MLPSTDLLYVYAVKFQEQDRHGIAVTSAHYVVMLSNFLTRGLSHYGNEILTTWFQQDCGTVHTVTTSIEVIQKMCLEHIISLHGELPWPEYLPLSLSTCVQVTKQ
jgi:hypothetical protein